MANNPVTLAYNTVGNAAANGASALANAYGKAARAVICPLYKNFPGGITGQQYGNPFAEAADSLLNDLCTPTGDLPPAPVVPFTGGQCVCVQYNVSFTLSGYGLGTINSSVVANGPIQSVFKRQTPGGQDFQTGFFAGSSGCNPGFVSLIQSALDGTTTINSVVRVDGQGDVCGDPPRKYPIVNIPAPSLNVNVPIVVSPNFTVNVPVAVFAPITQISPTLRIGDFNIDLDLGGLTISPGIDIEFPGSDPTGQPPQQPPPGQKPSERVEKCNLDEVLKYLRRIRECQECDRDYDFLQTGFVTGRSGSLTVPAGGIPLTVGLELVLKPTNSKEQPGLTEPNVVYAGWGWFSGNGFREERLPIDADLKLFNASEKPSPNQFSFTCQVGYEARATLTYKRLKNPLPSV